MLRVKIKTVEIGVAVFLLAFGALIFYESVQLGAGWSYSGPQAGFFPIIQAILIIIGCISVLYFVFRKSNSNPFFEVSQEIVDLLKVGVPILLTVVMLKWLGIFLVSGIYLGFFMIYYGKYKWWQGAIGALILPTILWLGLRQAFTLSMPMSVFYRSGALPF